MEFLGVGPLELFFILVIALIVLGPDDMVKAGRTLGRLMRRLVTSPTWQTVQQTSKSIRYLPNRLMREAGFDEQEVANEFNKLKESVPNTRNISQGLGLENIKEELKPKPKDDFSAWTTPPTLIDTPSLLPEENAAPGVIKPPEIGTTELPASRLEKPSEETKGSS